MPRKRESAIENNARLYAEGEGAQLVKNKPTIVGWPDRTLYTACGRVALVEFKRPGEYPTDIQVHWLRWLNDRGHVATWLATEREFIALFKWIVYHPLGECPTARPITR